MLRGLFDPRRLAEIFSIPASSHTARIAEDALTPDPLGAGFKNTLPAP